METKKVNQIKRPLERRGYKRHTKNLIGREDYAYMRTVRDADGELKYIISHGFRAYPTEILRGGVRGNRR